MIVYLIMLLPDLWKNIPSEEKSRYEDMAKQDKQRFAEEMSAYAPQTNEDNAESSPTKKKRSKKDKNAPKGFVVTLSAL